MRKWCGLFIVATVLMGPSPALGQVGVAGEGRVGVTLPMGDLSDADAEAGLALGLELMLNFQRNVTAYVGFNRHGFSCDRDCGLGSGLRSTGFGAGIKYIFPSPADALVWGRGGVIAHQLSSDEVSGDRNLGFELGAGIDMPVGDRFYLVPHLGVLTHSLEGDARATYLNFGLGLHYHFN
jgi:hypothetical protein